MLEAVPYVGIGIYTVADVALLTRVSRDRIRRWMRGYRYTRRGRRRDSPPVWQAQLPDIDGQPMLGFLDLLEVRFVNALLERGVRWRTIREAHRLGAERLGSAHPFCTHSFLTDGRQLFLDLPGHDNEPMLVEVTRSQQVFRRFLRPYLASVEYAGEAPRRWWPLQDSRLVVVDPQRNFGKPTVVDAGIPTRVLADAFAVQGSTRAVAQWFDVDEASVADAVRFEDQLAA